MQQTQLYMSATAPVTFQIPELKGLLFIFMYASHDRSARENPRQFDEVNNLAPSIITCRSQTLIPFQGLFHQTNGTVSPLLMVLGHHNSMQKDKSSGVTVVLFYLFLVIPKWCSVGQGFLAEILTRISWFQCEGLKLLGPYGTKDYPGYLSGIQETPGLYLAMIRGPVVPGTELSLHTRHVPSSL